MNRPDEPERVEHRMERRYPLAASPEQVWEVIATADGIASWMAPTRLEPQAGGQVTFDLGDYTSRGVVTDYTPNTRFAYEEPWPIAERPEEIAPDMAEWFDSIGVPLAEVYETLSAVTPIATEFLIEAESGGSCVLRVVTSAYGTGAEWEKEFFDQMVDSFGPLLDDLAARFEPAR
ncbi:SRPBCC domain-containing protein [Herbiconiux sp. CPCC 205763]|uniref:SRPBCC domain-containing protein n=1 Tax=Herbiconiux aconitum TaxID=2970913 RepID=A0ABT2GL31_9MICO|nr:SRPBCC domain-containing protein [Herbiconiux aconitum]MCS5716920.1 SRPBCC domain-containing protein [Herbiconiux aconitum]